MRNNIFNNVVQFRFHLNVVIVIALGLALPGSSLSARAQEPAVTEWTGNKNVQLRVRAGQASWRGETRLVAGIEIKLAPTWKTYWRTPGDAGIPPEISWDKSENLAKAEVLYPSPEALKDPYGTSIGYKERVVFPVLVTPKDDSKPVRLTMKMNYAICSDICMPVQAKQHLNISQNTVPEAGPLLTMALNQVPQYQKTPSKDIGVYKLDAELTETSPKLTFYVRYPANAAKKNLFVEGPDNLYVPMARKVKEMPRSRQTDDTIIIYQIDLNEANDWREFRGKTLTCTVVSEIKSIEQACSSAIM